MSLLEPAFTAWGVDTSWLELIAVVLGFICVVLNVLENHWGWPFAIVSSLLFTWLFAHSKLYGDAGVQIFFALASAWGWWQWLAGTRVRAGPLRTSGSPAAQRLTIAKLGWRRSSVVALIWLALWPLLGALLHAVTDSDVPYFDAFPTAGSVIGQILLGRKYVENWLVWLLVNVSSVGLLSYKSLYLSAGLYLVFVGVGYIGWRRWRAKLNALVQGGISNR
jgi:nicotinamide mononucleotide transporter